jgi:hypothetical protein
MDIEREDFRLGGAASVAMLANSLGADVTLAGVIGRDRWTQPSIGPAVYPALDVIGTVARLVCPASRARLPRSARGTEYVKLSKHHVLAGSFSPWSADRGVFVEQPAK